MGPTVRKVVDELVRSIDGIKALEAENAELVHQRDNLRRFLDIDAEKAELDRLRTEAAGIIATAQSEAEGLLTKARSEVDGIRQKAVDTAELTATSIINRAQAESETIRTEAEHAARGLRDEARQIVVRAQADASKLTQEAKALQIRATQDAHEASVTLNDLERREQAVREREQALSVAESAFKKQKDVMLATLATG